MQQLAVSCSARQHFQQLAVEVVKVEPSRLSFCVTLLSHNMPYQVLYKALPICGS